MAQALAHRAVVRRPGLTLGLVLAPVAGLLVLLEASLGLSLAWNLLFAAPPQGGPTRDGGPCTPWCSD